MESLWRAKSVRYREYNLNSSHLTIIKLLGDAGCFIEKWSDLSFRHIPTTTEREKFNFLQFWRIAPWSGAMSTYTSFSGVEKLTASTHIPWVCIVVNSVRIDGSRCFYTLELCFEHVKKRSNYNNTAIHSIFFKWSRMHLSSIWINALTLHSRHRRPNGENVNSSCIG